MFRPIFAVPIVLAAAALLMAAMPAAANLPPSPLPEAMAAVTGDYEMAIATGAARGACPVQLNSKWVESGNEAYAQFGIDAACLASVFAAHGLAEPLQWTVFDGGGIRVKSGATELRFRPNYEPGSYFAERPQAEGAPPVQFTLKRVKP